MRSRNFILLLCFLAVVSVPAAAVAESALEWDPSSGDVNGYMVYYGTSPGNYPEKKDAGNSTRFSLANFAVQDATTYYFVVRAYNEFGESPSSNEISWTSGDSTPPMPPQGLSVE